MSKPLIPNMGINISIKQLQNEYKGTNTKVRLIKDDLGVGNQSPQNPFNTNKLQCSPSSVIPPLSSIQHTEILTIQGSHFQGHAKSIKSVKEAAQACESLFQSTHVANAHHVIYAYAVTEGSGMTITGHSDDKEWSASTLILNLIKDQQRSNVFVAVSRRHDGLNLGPKRFSAISSTATKALNSVGVFETLYAI